MSEMTQGQSPTDASIAEDEPELHLPEPRAIPVEILNMTLPSPAQALATQAFNINYGDNPTQILQADPLRSAAQITAYGDGQIWLCHSRSAADMVAALLDNNQGVSQLQSVTGVTPAAATNFVYTLPNPAKFLSVAYTFVTDATVGNRFLSVSVLDTNGNIVAGQNPAGTVVASTTLSPRVAVGGVAQLSASGATYQGFPNLPELPAGYQIVLASSFYGAADQYSNIHMLFQEGANAGPIGDDAPGIPVTGGMVVPVTSTAPLWAVASGDNMVAGVLQERRQN